MSIKIYPDARGEDSMETLSEFHGEHEELQDQDQDEDDQNITATEIWSFAKWTLLVLLILWLCHMLCLGLAVWHIKHQIDTQAFQIETLQVDLAGKENIEIRAKAGFQPSWWFYAFLVKLYKPAKVTLSVPTLGLHDETVTVHLPALQFGHEFTTIDLTDDPIKLNISEFHLDRAVEELAVATGDFGRLAGYEIEGEVTVKVSLFTMTFWVPVWLNRTITIPIKVPIGGTAETTSKAKDGKKPVVEPSAIQISESGDFNVNVNLKFNYDALPISIPLEVSIPELTLSLGSRKGAFLNVVIPTQTMTQTNPSLSASAAIATHNADNMVALIHDLALLHMTTTVTLSTFGTPQECMLQRAFANAIPALTFSVQRLAQMAVNAKTSMQRDDDVDVATITPEMIEAAHRMALVRVESVEGEGRTAVAKASITVTPPGNPPLDILTGIPSFTATIAGNGAVLAEASVSVTARESLRVEAIAKIHNLTPILQALVMAVDCKKGAVLSGFPESFRDKTVTITLGSTQPTINRLLRALQLQVGRFDDQLAKAWLTHAPDTDLLTVPDRCKLNPVVMVPVVTGVNKRRPVIRPSHHTVTVDHEQDAVNLSVNLRVTPQRQNTSPSPYITVEIPTVHLQVSTDSGPILDGRLDGATVNMSTTPGADHPLANLWSATPITASVNLAGPPSESGKHLGYLVNQALRRDTKLLTISATTAGPDAPRFTQTVALPPEVPKVRRVVLAPPRIPPFVRFLKGTSVGVKGIGEGRLFAGASWLDAVSCGADSAKQFDLDVQVSLPEVSVRVGIAQDDAAAVNLPTTQLAFTIRDMSMCRFKVNQSGSVSDNRSILLSLQPNPNIHTVLAALTTPDHPAVITLRGGSRGTYLDQMIDNLNLTLPPPPIPPSARSVSQLPDDDDGDVDNPLAIELTIDSDQTSFDILAQVDLPRPTGSKPSKGATYSPLLKIQQDPITLTITNGHSRSLQLHFAKVLIPIRTEERLPASPTTPYTETLSVRVSGRCAACTADSIHAAINSVLSDASGEGVGVQVAIGENSGAAFEVPLVAIKPVFEVLARSLEHIKNPHAIPEPTPRTEPTATTASTDSWLQVKVRAGPVGGQQIGQLPCPFADICEAQQPDTLKPLLAISAALERSLDRFLEQQEINLSMARLAIPRATGLSVSLQVNTELGVKVSVNRAVDLAAVRLLPFRLSATTSDSSSDEESDDDITAELWVNGGGAGLHELTAPLQVLPIPHVDPIPALLSHLPLSVNVGSFSDNLLSRVVSGVLFDVCVGAIFAPAGTAATEQQQAAGPPKIGFEIGEVTDNSMDVDVTVQGGGEPLVALPPGISLLLNRISITIQDGQHHQLLAASVDGDIVGSVDKLVARLSVSDGEALGIVLGNLVSGTATDLAVTISVGDAVMRLPLRYQLPDSYPYTLSRLAILDQLHSKGHISTQTKPTMTVKRKVGLLEEQLVPELPVLLDPIPLIFKRLLKSIYTCLDQPHTLFALTTRLAIKQSVLPPELSALRVGLVGVRLSGMMSRTLAYYYTQSRKNILGASHVNTVTMGPRECVPTAEGVYETTAYLACARHHPFMILGQPPDGTAVVKSRKLRRVKEAADVFAELTKTLKLVSPLLGIPRDRIDNFQSVMSFVLGNAADDQQPDRSHISLSTTYSDARHIIDSVVNEGGLCVRLRPTEEEPSGFLELAVGGTGRMMPLHIPLNNLRIPVPIDNFSDPCGQFSASCHLQSLRDSALLVSGHAQGGQPQNSATLASAEKPSGQAWTDTIVDPLANWQIDFTFHKERLLQYHSVNRQMPALSLMLRPKGAARRSALLSVNFVTHYEDRLESNAMRLARELPYLGKAEHFFQTLINTTDQLASPQHPATTNISTAFHTNAITLRLNDRPLYLNGTDIKAVKVNGVFPPLAESVKVTVKYSAVDGLLTTECRDALVDADAPTPPTYRTVFPVNLHDVFPDIGDGEGLEVGFGAQSGRGLSAFGFVVDQVASATASADLDRADLFLPSNDTTMRTNKDITMVVRLRDECGRPQYLRHQKLSVRVVNANHKLVMAESIADSVDGMFKFTFKSAQLGTHFVEIRMHQRWHRLVRKPVYISGSW